MHNIDDHNKIEILEQYLSGELGEAEAKEVEKSIREDAGLQQDIEIIRLAQDAVRSSSLRKKASEWHRKYRPTILAPDNTEAKPDATDTDTTSSIPLWVSVSRVAAVLFIGVFGYFFIQFATLSPNDLYEENFVEYKLPVTRSTDADISNIDSLYSVKDYQQLIQRFEQLAEPTLQDRFLAALSYMHQSDFAPALAQFEAIEQENSRRSSPIFEQETDYYQALALIEVGKFDQAERLLQNIKNDPDHIFRKNVSNADLRKLKILNWKN